MAEESDLPGDVTVRPFAPADQAEARRMILEGLREHFGFIDERLNRDLDDIAASYANGLFLVAEAKGKLVGTGALVHVIDGVDQVVRMSVDGGYRRRGIGRAILTRLLERARSAGRHWAVLGTNDDWDDAIAFYRANGFTPIWRGFGGVGFALDLRDQGAGPSLLDRWAFVALLAWRRLRP